MYSAQYGGRSGRAKGKTSKPKREKCVRCGAKGHAVEACTKPVKEGAGENEEQEMAKLRAIQQAKNSGGAGSGISHKTSRAANAKPGKDGSNGNGKHKEGGSGAGGADHQSIPSPFLNDSSMTLEGQGGGGEVTGGSGGAGAAVEDWFEVWDAGCDVGASLDALSASLGSAKKASAAYQSAMAVSASDHYQPHQTVYGGCLCRVTLKPNKPIFHQVASERCRFILGADPHTYFVLGLGPGFCTGSSSSNNANGGGDEDDDDSEEEADDDEDDDEEEEEAAKDQFQEAVSALTDSMDRDGNVVVGVWAKLDYTAAILERPGNDRETQLRRFRATCTAAVQCGVPVQVRLSPGAGDVGGDEEALSSSSSSNAKKGTMVSLSPYVQGVKDLAKVLLEFDGLKVHISCWNGTSAHMSKLLQAFPDTLYIGLTAAVGFSKAADAHECAFDVPLSKLILETDAVIPSEVVTALGRKAFAHSGAVGFCAAAVAHQKKLAPKTVARQASLNTVQLYGNALTVRSKQAAQEAAVLEAERVAALAEEEQEELVVAELATQQEEDAEGPAQLTKKQKKKKKKKGGQQQQSDDADKDFDDEHLATLLDEKL